MNVVPIKAPSLEDLAHKINVCAAKADDYRLTAACHLAEAKRLCHEQGVTFKDWIKDNIKFSYHEAVKLAIAGESDNPRKAIEDMRARSRDSMAKTRVVQRGTTVTTYVRPEEDEEDEDEEIVPGHHLPNSARIRGFFFRAKEAKELAEADNLAGIEATEEMREAASQAAKAWIELLSKLEGND